MQNRPNQNKPTPLATKSKSPDEAGGFPIPYRRGHLLLFLICRMIRTYFLDVPNEAYATFKLGNCEVMEFNL